MNTTSVAETVSNPSWSTPAISAPTQSWPPSTSYEQYYNYYQTVPPPTTTTAASTNYQQDYSQAWDEYYKAYYGQSYATTAATTQYSTNYSYDQYGYANFSAPPPNYYDAPPQSSTYDYTQPTQPTASASSYPAYNAAPTASIPPTTNWSEPPPTFAQPSTYNNAQSYEQSQLYNQPPPISTTYESPIEQNNVMQPPIGDQQINAYRDLMPAKQQKFTNPKMYETNSNSNYKVSQPPMNNPTAKESSYLEQFPPPSFGSPVKTNNRGRGGGAGPGPGAGGGGSSFGNTRGRQQAPRSNSNFNQGRNQSFGRGAFGNKNNDRRQFNSNEYSNESSFSNIKQNNMGNRRGNRGGFNPGRGRNVENQGYQQRNTVEPWYQQNEMNDSANETGFVQHQFEDQDFFPKEQNQEFDETGYVDWGVDKTQQNPDFDSQNYSQENIEGMHQQREMEIPKYGRNIEGGPPIQKHGLENQDMNRMNLQNAQQRNGGFFQNNSRPQFRQPERNHRPVQPNPRQQMARIPNIPMTRPPVKLMDVVVQLSMQSPVIKRRQAIIDKWQKEVKEVQTRRMTINYFFPVLSSTIAPELRHMLFVNCYNQMGCMICELVLDDIFLVQGRGDNEDLALESASKMLVDLFKNRVFVLTATRNIDGEMMPGFCISPNQQGTVNLPPICRNSDFKSNNAQCLTESQPENVIVPPPSAPPPTTATTTQAPSQEAEQGVFLVIESSTNERDQSIASLVATARFNSVVIDYQHEKLPHAPHISSCVITIDGEEVERHEARDYLVAKRQAADKVIAKLKLTRPHITLRLEKAKTIKKEEFKKDEPFDKVATEFLQNFNSSPEDVPLKFDSDFSMEEKNTLVSVAPGLNLSHKSEGKNTLFIFKQFPIVEMKKLLLAQGYCAQYQLIEKGSDCSSQ